MGWFGFLLLLLIFAGGVYFYQKLLSIEHEIRREQAESRPVAQSSPGDDVVKPEVAPPIFKEQVKLEPAVPDTRNNRPTNLEDGLLKVVTELPGLLQTEIYALFPGEERKRLQTLLLQLDRNGVIRREKKKSSYRVFPV